MNDTLICPTTVTVIRGGRSAEQLHVQFAWTAYDPVAVALVIYNHAEEPVDWVLARELFPAAAAGIDGGDGDVRVQLADDPTYIDVALGRPEQFRIVLRIAWKQVAGFFDRSYELVPPLAEIGIVNDELDVLFARGLE